MKIIDEIRQAHAQYVPNMFNLTAKAPAALKFTECLCSLKT